MITKKSSIFLFTFVFSIQLFGGGKLDKAFEALSIYDYFKAKELFTKALKKEQCGASYGLARIYFNERNPFTNLDSARSYALYSEAAWIDCKEKERRNLQSYAIDSIAIRNFLNEIAAKAFSLAEKSNSIDDFEYFIDNYTYSELRPSAISKRNALVYQAAKEINTSAAYKEFMDLYPSASEFGEAKEQYQLRLFEESISFSRISDIEQFIKNFPSSPYIAQANDKLYELYTADKKVESYESFIKKYPYNPNVRSSWEQIYKIRTEKLSPEILAEFLLEYPHYPDREFVKDELRNLLKVLIPAPLNGKWGFIDTSGTWVIRPLYDSCEPFVEGMALISIDNKFGFINASGVEVILADYEDAESFHGAYAVVYDGEKYGAINRFGDLKIKMEYDDIGDFVNGYAYASKNSKYGYIDENSFVIIPFIYEQAFNIEKGRALVKQYGKFGIVDMDNNWIVPFEFDWIEPHFKDSLIKVKRQLKFGLINSKMDSILAIEYDFIGRIDQDLILVIKDNKVGYIDQKGEWLIPMIYESDPFTLDWGEFDKGLARIKIKGKMGIIDTSGSRIVPAIFDEIGFYDGLLFPVKKGGKWGYADQSIKLIIPYRYEQALPFEGDIARVMKNGKWGLIDRTNKRIVPLEYNKITFSEGVYITENDTAYGMLDYIGNTILDPIFDQIKYNPIGFYELKLNGKLAYLDIYRRKVFWKEIGFSIP
jgi:hypothetical protein